MYIPSFWCGVIATIIVEVAFVIVGSMIGSVKNGGKDNE